MAAGWNLQLIVETWLQGGLIATRVGLAVAKSHTCERHACVVSNKQARLKYAERMGQGGRDNMHISWWGNTNLNSRVSYGEALWRKVLRERSFHTLLLPLNPHLLATFLHAHAAKSSFLHNPFASPSFLHFRASSVVVFCDLDVDDLSPPPSSTSEADSAIVFRDLGVDDLSPPPSSTSELVLPSSFATLMPMTSGSVVIFRDLDVDDLSPPPSSTSELVLPSSFATSMPTTFATLLISRGKFHESITYNGKAFSNAMKRSRGFVTQDYVLYPHLIG
ncbi:hypothetical protein JHK85_018879 [Glycine max]|nr:hypothetical protein JHK85_018879 [Glycine max]